MDGELRERVMEAVERARKKWVIVEGKRDAKALKELGFSRVVSLKGPLFRTVEGVGESEVVVLTDLDKEGRKLFGRLSKDLCARRVQVDNELRGLLFRTELRQIEGLVSYLWPRKQIVE